MQYKAQIMRSRDIRRPFISLTSNELVLQEFLFASNKHAEPVHETASVWCGIALYWRLFWGRTPSLHLLPTAKMRSKLRPNLCYKTALVPWCNSV